MSYRLFVPKQAAGASLIYFDLWNPTGTAHKIEVYSIIPVVSGAVAVVGVVGVNLFLTRTTAIGTGGTAATREGTSQTAMTFASMTGAMSLPNISARLTPTGGATGGTVISWRSVFSEETSAASYFSQPDLVRGWLGNSVVGIMVPENSGISVVQGGVASVGNIGFDVTFGIVRST